MSNRIQIELPMPAVGLNITGKYAVIERPSGMDYMLLKIIKFGLNAEHKYTIAEVMNIFGLPADMTPFIISEVNRLVDIGMIKHHTSSNSKIKDTTRLSSLEFTDAGNEIFNTKSVATSIGDIDIKLLYKPGMNQKYSRNAELEYTDISHSFEYNEPENKSIESYIRNSDSYDIKPEDRLYNVQFKKDRARKYLQEVDLSFDRNAGAFMFSSGFGADTTFIKMNYTGDEIVKAIPDSTFVLDENLGYELKKWDDVLPSTGYISILPCDFEYEGAILLAGPKLAKISKDIESMPLPENSDCDAIEISSNLEGNRLWFVRKDAEIQGFNTTKSVKLVLQQPMTENEITDVLNKTSDTLRFEWTDELAKLDKITTTLRDNQIMFRIIDKRIADGNLETLKDTLTRINGFETSSWYLNLSREMENVACTWVDNGMSVDNLIECLDTMIRRDFKMPGRMIVPKMLETYNIMTVADWSLYNDIATDLIFNDSFRLKTIETILNGTKVCSTSELFKKITTATDDLSYLIKTTGIDSTVQYSFNAESFDENTGKEIAKYATQFKNIINELEESISSKAVQKQYGILKKYADIFDTIGSALRSKKKFKGRKDYRSEPNSLLFCARLNHKLKTEIGRLFESDEDIPDKVVQLVDSAKIDKDVYDGIREYLDSRDKCCTGFVDSEIDTESKKKWTDAVFALTEIDEL